MALIGRKQDNGSSDSPAATPRRNRANRTQETCSKFADDPLDPMLDVKKRARRRLIGAIALVIGAIVFVPMIFEPESRPIVDDISIRIPDKNASLEPVAPAKPAAKPESPVPAAESTTETSAVSSDKGAAEPASSATAGPEKTAFPNPPNAKAGETRPAESKVSELPKSGSDDPRAVALLQGQPESSAEAKTESYAVQIGAFSDVEKVKSLRDKLNAGGFKTYTEVTKTTQGDRTRLRLGPYSSRVEADKVQERIKKLFVLDATVVPL